MTRPARSANLIQLRVPVARKKKVFDEKKEVRAIARERIGIVPSTKIIVPKEQRPPKHKKKIEEESL